MVAKLLKIFLKMILILFAIVGINVFAEVLPQDPYYDTPQQSIETDVDVGPVNVEIDIWLWGDQGNIDTVKEDVVAASVGGGSVLIKLIRSFGFNYLDKGPSTAAYYVALVVNYFLGILGFLALLVLIYGFARIIWASDDHAIEDAKKIVISAAVGILVIGISWYLVSWVFQLYFNTVW